MRTALGASARGAEAAVISDGVRLNDAVLETTGAAAVGPPKGANMPMRSIRIS